MVTALQILVFALTILSTILVVSIPVILASPGQWEQSKNLVFTGAGVWSGLVIVTGLLNSFAT
uniref:Photosystem II reaction center protein Z n=1 Tax=Porphyridium purpureum TaxID=35688 RepID=W0RZ40_PORPP|nr:photosystem II protein Z [Porphyridium purpureum]7Y5E_Z6 Chain Z6, Photosystem II reaction center protein Z [Porphyridium purpureum]7Y5E_ZL Chain ZL, Photosystem II reaction center protein Z [Porphyridium purpureum]7Y5E_z6 Chain z6, Photosystem II reaction center protein Z [Porphyridium purpureum]7Y5E_zL Chain zL, Photosystem II reaction center protein Z [Porphyridium purpureum]7Y7A_Z9 Chain Z9, Photosystem II reaction center protein Z [Porphyridium purpureum]7Y7A_ZE Chain ZE, Photosystem 